MNLDRRTKPQDLYPAPMKLSQSSYEIRKSTRNTCIIGIYYLMTMNLRKGHFYNNMKFKRKLLLSKYIQRLIYLRKKNA